jgi:hypothetical protein
MSLTGALDRYFAAWNDHDPDAVVRSLADGNNGYLGSFRDHRAPQLHLHRVGERRGCHGRTPHRCSRRRDAPGKNRGTGDNAFGVTSIWKPEVLNGVFHAGHTKPGDLAELAGQWL